MGLISTILGAGGAARQVGEAVGGVAEVFVGNRAARDEAASQQYLAAVGAYGAEFAAPAGGPFDRFVNALNRLPRPMLALGTLGLFVYAMAEPAGFSTRMQGLALVPEPLWWLLGAIVSFYFGARELHHQRSRTLQARGRPRRAAPAAREDGGSPCEPSAPASTPTTTPRSRSGAACAGESRAAGGARGPKPSRRPLRISMRLQPHRTEDPDAQVPHPTHRHRHRPRRPDRDRGRGRPARPGGNHGDRGRLAPVRASVAGRFRAGGCHLTRGLKPSRPTLRILIACNRIVRRITMSKCRTRLVAIATALAVLAGTVGGAALPAHAGISALPAD